MQDNTSNSCSMSLKSAFKNFYKDFRISLSANENPLFMAYYRYIYQPKQGSLAEFLSVYSLSKKGKFTVIQIGANDGITNDPIHKFIKRDRWRGVLLEPQSEVFNLYLKKIYQKNEGLTPICAGIGEEDGFQTLYKIAFSNQRWATGLASFSKEKVEELFENGIVEKNCRQFGITIPKNIEERITGEEVEIISPQTLLKRFKISSIDLLQIDAEGFDLEVIRIFNVPKTLPKALIFENVNHSKEALESSYQQLKALGYKLKEFGRDTLAVYQSEKDMMRFLD